MYVEKKCKQLNYDGSECDLRGALILQKSSIFRIQKGFLSYSSSQMRRVWKGFRWREGMRGLFNQAVMYYSTIVL